MKLIRVVTIFLVLLSFTACSIGKYDRLAADYRQRSPVTDAESDYRAHDYRIYFAMGVGRYFPGLDDDLGRKIANEHGAMMLPHTSDALESRSHVNYLRAAGGYASAYNKRKAALIAQRSR